jgi:hypothetical protein
MTILLIGRLKDTHAKRIFRCGYRDASGNNAGEWGDPVILIHSHNKNLDDMNRVLVFISPSENGWKQ